MRKYLMSVFLAAFVACVLAGCGSPCGKAGWLPDEKYIVERGAHVTHACTGRGTFYYADETSKTVFFICNQARLGKTFDHEATRKYAKDYNFNYDEAQFVLYFIPRGEK